MIRCGKELRRGADLEVDRKIFGAVLRWLLTVAGDFGIHFLMDLAVSPGNAVKNIVDCCNIGGNGEAETCAM